MLDFGSGCGLAGLVALRSGAAVVVCNDIDPFAAEATLLNAEANHMDMNNSRIRGDMNGRGFRLQTALHGVLLTSTEDLIGCPLEECFPTSGPQTAAESDLDSTQGVWPTRKYMYTHTVVLAGDMCFEDALATRVISWLKVRKLSY